MILNIKFSNISGRSIRRDLHTPARSIRRHERNRSHANFLLNLTYELVTLFLVNFFRATFVFIMYEIVKFFSIEYFDFVFFNEFAG